MALYPAMSMGERILFIRENCGDLSQEELAGKLGLTKSAISGYETGRRVPPDHVIKHIAHVFNLDEDWLRDGVGEPFFPTPDDALDELFYQFKCSDFERSFLSSYFDMPDNDRHEFSEYLKQFFHKLVEWTVENKTAPAQQKMPTPVSEDGQDELENYVRKHKKNLTVGQQQQILEMMQTMIASQKEPLSASAQQIVDEKAPKTGRLGQS